MSRDGAPKRVHQPLEWYCREHSGAYHIGTRFRLFNGVDGYDNCAEVRIPAEHVAVWGAEAVMDKAVYDLERTVKDTLYAALCNDRDLLSNSWLHERVTSAEGEAYGAKVRAQELEDKAAQYLRLIREVAGES